MVRITMSEEMYAHLLKTIERGKNSHESEAAKNFSGNGTISYPYACGVAQGCLDCVLITVTTSVEIDDPAKVDEAKAK